MRSKAPLALMEQLMMVAVFALAAAVCVQAFTLSGRISKNAAAKDRAVIEAQTAAEYAKAGKESEYASAYGGIVNGNAGCMVSFDRNWEPVSPLDESGDAANKAVAYQLFFTYLPAERENPYCWTAEINVTDTAGEKLYTLTVAGQNGEAAS